MCVYMSLYIYIVGGQANALTELISFGCALQDIDKHGGTALHLAAEAAAIQLGMYYYTKSAFK